MNKSLDAWFDHVRDVLETAYLGAPDDEPWKQSGQSGPHDRWTALRKPIADCMDRSGAFLDIGCANGYLMECVARWTAERDIAIEPYGLDISSKLVELAKRRLPHWADRFFVGNAFYWTPPRKFEFVRTELVYVPGENERAYVDHLMQHYVEPNGALLIAQYGEDRDDYDRDPMRGLLTGAHPTRRILDRLAELNITWHTYCDGYDPVKGRKVRIVKVNHQSAIENPKS